MGNSNRRRFVQIQDFLLAVSLRMLNLLLINSFFATVINSVTVCTISVNSTLKDVQYVEGNGH